MLKRQRVDNRFNSYDSQRGSRVRSRSSDQVRSSSCFQLRKVTKEGEKVLVQVFQEEPPSSSVTIEVVEESQDQKVVKSKDLRRRSSDAGFLSYVSLSLYLSVSICVSLSL